MAALTDEEREITRFTMRWEGISIDVAYEPSWLGMDRTAHLQLSTATRTVLPVTETGYRSHFLPKEDVDADGGPEEYVRSWLDLAAQSPQWIANREANRQLSLF